MGTAAHLSVRVPWHDDGWNGTVCADPLGNASCVLLKNIGNHRDDSYEIAHAGQPLTDLDPGHVPCVVERATFMSPASYTVDREHPYQFNPALRGVLAKTPITVPAYGVFATPYYWLLRKSMTEGLLDAVDVDFRDLREDEVDRILGISSSWVMHGDNQQALIERFFADVERGTSLVFFYVKHSPFDGYGAGERLLVGAARVTGVTLPGRWHTDSPSPFPNHMWETVLRHSLRPDGRDGVLLPLAQLARLDAQGVDVSPALAWAPEQGREFSYVTEHVSDDSAIEALERLLLAAQRSAELGADVPAASFDWISDQIGELWTMRGPAPGLGSVMSSMGVRFGPVVAREIERHTNEDADPWNTFVDVLEGRTRQPELTRFVTGTPRKVWAGLTGAKRGALKLLSRFQLTPEQAMALLTGETGTAVRLGVEDLLEDPYYAYLCLLGGPHTVGFEVIDRGCFPDPVIRARFPLDGDTRMADGSDGRRLQALIVAILEDAAVAGDTVLPMSRVIESATSRRLSERCVVNEEILRAYDLHPEALPYESPWWPPLIGTQLGDGSHAFKLNRLNTYAEIIRERVDSQLSKPRHTRPGDLGELLKTTLDKHPVAQEDSAAEAKARIEKNAALIELFESPLSVLNGRAGTGKTTLIEALVRHPEVARNGVLLLAPTGKARVQLRQKVGVPAQTIAQFLGRLRRYEWDTGRHLIGDDLPRAKMYGTVVIDESSMLTEEQLAAVFDALRPAQRLVLVGDPRQLPPIGAGRPFVDLITRLTRDVPLAEFPRTATGYAELRILRRQSGQIRDDLLLASWFSGDEIPEGADEVWERLRSGANMRRLGAARWTSPRPEGTIDPVLAAELNITGAQAAAAFELSYGGQYEGAHLNFPKGPGGAGEQCEAWQIITPTRGHAWGTVELNRHLKAGYRRRALDRAQQPYRKRTVAKPLGAEQIVVGDKVLNNRNRRREAYPAGRGLDYVANGEIGVVVGAFGKPGAPGLKYTKVEFSSQVGTEYSYVSLDDDDADLELAWAITIHKSQGSEFGTVFVVLPRSSRQLSRELLYTALTRQQERVVLIHETSIEDLWELTRSIPSETARRLTDLFIPAMPREVTLPDGSPAGMLDSNLVHLTAGGILVRSKNEVIIASILDDLAPGDWTYEQPLLINGVTRYPDFTITTADGRTLFWEHLGLLDNPDYQRGWERKLKWYESGGILPAEQGGGGAGTLMWTDDRNGVDVPAWTARARELIGQTDNRFRVTSRTTVSSRIGTKRQ